MDEGQSKTEDVADDGKRVATRNEIIKKLNKVPAFQIVDGNKNMCATMTSNGPCGTYFLDHRDAQALRAQIQQHNPGMTIDIDVIPLGNAFALTEKWVKMAQQVPLRLQGSKAVLASMPGFPGLPHELKGAFSPLSSNMPIWVLEELHTESAMPYFLHLEDARHAWDAGQARQHEGHAR